MTADGGNFANWHLTLLYYACILCLGLSSAALGPTLLSLGQLSDESDITILSWIFVVRALAYTVGSTLSGWAADRDWAHEALLATLCNGVLTLCLIPHSRTLWLTFALFAVNGLSNGALTNVPQALTIRLWGKDVGPYMQALHALYALGGIISPLVAKPYVAKGKDPSAISVVFYVIAAVHLVVAVWLLVVIKCGPRNNLCKEEAKNDANGQQEAEGTAQYRRRVVGLTAFFIFLYVGTEVTFSGLLFTFAEEGAALGPSGAASITTLFWVTFFVGRVACVVASARCSSATLLSVALPGVLVSLAVMLLWNVVSIEFLWVGVALFGFFNAPIYASMIVLLEQFVPVTGSVISVLIAGDTLGEMSVPLLVGQLMGMVGMNSFIATTLAIVLLATGVFILLRSVGQRGKVAAVEADGFRPLAGE